MRVLITRTRMAMKDPHYSYDLYVPIESVINGYLNGRSIHIYSINGAQYVDYVTATLPADHFKQDPGALRYSAFKSHQSRARKIARILAATVFPEIWDMPGDTLPELWVPGPAGLHSTERWVENIPAGGAE